MPIFAVHCRDPGNGDISIGYQFWLNQTTAKLWWLDKDTWKIVEPFPPPKKEESVEKPIENRHIPETCTKDKHMWIETQAGEWINTNYLSVVWIGPDRHGVWTIYGRLTPHDTPIVFETHDTEENAQKGLQILMDAVRGKA